MKIHNEEGIVFMMLPKERKEAMIKAFESGGECSQAWDNGWKKIADPCWNPERAYKVEEKVTKLASEWLKELPEHIQWALPEYEDVERGELFTAVHSLPPWDETEQGVDFWQRVAKKDYPTKAETALATWKGVQVRLSYWRKERYFIPQAIDDDGDVVGINQNGERESWHFLKLENWEVYTEPTTKLASEWFKQLPEHIKWALPEYDDEERKSLRHAVYGLPNWGTLPQGRLFWLGVANADYPTKAETVLATWEDKKVRRGDMGKDHYFIPKTVKNGAVRGVDQDGDRVFWTFSCLTDWEVYTEPEQVLIDPVRLLGKILWDEKGNALNVITQVRSDSEVKGLEENGYQWSDTVDSERQSMWVEEKS